MRMSPTMQRFRRIKGRAKIFMGASYRVKILFSEKRNLSELKMEKKELAVTTIGLMIKFVRERKLL